MDNGNTNRETTMAKAQWKATTELTTEERKTVDGATGRILRMGSRPFQEGDLEEFDRCKNIVMAIYSRKVR